MKDQKQKMKLNLKHKIKRNLLIATSAVSIATSRFALGLDGASVFPIRGRHTLTIERNSLYSNALRS